MEFETRVVMVDELREMWHRDDSNIEIDTPDGFQKIAAWFDKGRYSILHIEATNGLATRCANTHLLQRASGEWMLADELVIGDEILTERGVSRIASICEAGVEDCFDFEVDHPNHRYWGDGFSSHNSGKSYIVSGNIVRDALLQGCHVVLLDSEDALKATWMRALGVDPDHRCLTKEIASTVNHIAQCIRDYTDSYVEEFIKTPREEQPKLLFVVDSLGMVETDNDIEQFNKGELKGDKGLKPKMLKLLVQNCIRTFAGFQIGLVATNHTYKSQDMYNPDDMISGGSPFIFASSIVVSMNKRKLKALPDGTKTPEVQGIRAVIKCIKTRYAKPFEEVEVLIPYSTGMDPYSGMFEMCERTKRLVLQGNKYVYVGINGKEHKLSRKQMTPAFFDMIMHEWRDVPVPQSDVLTEDSVDDE